MPNPKRKHSKARRDKRRSANSKMYASNLSVCS
ncbi:MAG: 50S ribosomal protein L32, partial [Candidatus Omnitrophica bacterium]|nr:50S ribosomal protein L32 [Candidatus Omnitrophota bacterium]